MAEKYYREFEALDPDEVRQNANLGHYNPVKTRHARHYLDDLERRSNDSTRDESLRTAKSAKNAAWIAAIAAIVAAICAVVTWFL